MTNVLPDFIEEILQTGKLNLPSGIVAVTGFSNRNNLIFLQNLIKKHQARKTLEIGMAYGGSASIILHTLSQTPGDFKHYAIDPYQSKWFHSYAVALLKKHNLDKNLSVFEDASQIVLAELLKNGETFDLIYIDGSHDFDDVFVDAYFSMRLLNKNGILVFDDCSDKDVLKVIRYMDTLGETFRPLEIRDYVSFNSFKNLIYPVGRLLGKIQVRAYQKVNKQ
jgi:predicted O-methyltransferase YrrM